MARGGERGPGRQLIKPPSPRGLRLGRGGSGRRRRPGLLPVSSVDTAAEAAAKWAGLLGWATAQSGRETFFKIIPPKTENPNKI